MRTNSQNRGEYGSHQRKSVAMEKEVYLRKVAPIHMVGGGETSRLECRATDVHVSISFFLVDYLVR